MARSDALITTTNIRNLYSKTIDLVFAVILLFITLTMVIGVVRLFYRVGSLLEEGGITGNYLYIFSDVLTLFILIELSRSLFEYFNTRRLRITLIIDAGIVFVLRHIMIDLFNYKLETDNIYALSALLLALGAIRMAASYEFQRTIKNTPDRDTDKPATTP